MLFLPLDHPQNWYAYDVRGSIELLNGYVADIEFQVNKSIANFQGNAKEVVAEGIHPDDPPQFIKVHQGLDDATWDLREIFGEYFPNLQRRSALITLFSFFEYELNKLCTLLQRTENREQRTENREQRTENRELQRFFSRHCWSRYRAREDLPSQGCITRS